MTMPSRHAAERIALRLTDAGMTAGEIAAAFAQALKCGVEAGRTPTAVRLMVLDGQVNQTRGERSNGNTVWGIYRGGTLVTVMLRRSTQPSTAEAMRVERIVL